VPAGIALQLGKSVYSDSVDVSTDLCAQNMWNNWYRIYVALRSVQLI